MQDHLSAADESGYLSKYGWLQEVETEDGRLFGWLDFRRLRAGYNSVMLDSIELSYPTAVTLTAAQQQEVDKLRAELDQYLRTSIASFITVVNEPGVGVMRFKPAITGVSPVPEADRYEAIAVDGLIGGALAVPDRALIISLEGQLQDSQSAQLLGEVLRKDILHPADSPQDSTAALKTLMRSWTREAGDTLLEIL